MDTLAELDGVIGAFSQVIDRGADVAARIGDPQLAAELEAVLVDASARVDRLRCMRGQAAAA